ncbi:MAG: hypothetical protein JWN03_2133 [Nocardia sp.]|uniref:alpha/beta hydrolase n=1 Tax=Nocardia sp. TaxID=1821 RepID=UPI00261493A5|nr:hypothetical protein [Nocardia sp.]MCU1641858.1 hypothetical protein [Nocardia sp.]
MFTRLLAGGGNPDAEDRALPVGLDHALDLGHIGVIGHSSGGYAAIQAMHDYQRIGAAIDLDGQIGVDEDFGSAATEGVDRPVLVMTSRQIEQVGDANLSLGTLWQHGTGWKRQLTMSNSAHYDYTDMPLPVPEVARPAAKTYVGPIPAARSAALAHTYIAAIFDKFLRHRTGTPLDQSPAEPEISVIR